MIRRPQSNSDDKSTAKLAAMQRTPLLSLCIPTYNRLAYLQELLPLILHELDSVNTPQHIKVVLEISDNATTDGTEVYLQSIHRQDVLTKRQKSNIGADNNIRFCASQACGEYVWVFGDDDLFTPGSFAMLLNLLQEIKPALTILSAHGGHNSVTYDSYEECIRAQTAKQRSFTLSHTLISANIFKREIFSETASLRHHATNYGHMYGVLAGLRQGGRVVLLDGVLRTRKQRAAFAVIPLALSLKQAVYLRRVALLFNVPELKTIAFVHTLNLPLELISHIMHICFPQFMRRNIKRRSAQ